ncbi:potassium transporter-domain-containing protein, partial [Pavlovales sp. CCMP2436]
ISQGHALGFIPCVLVQHTSTKQPGQGHGASAYGLAVTMDAVVTSTLTTIVLLHVWKWRPILIVPIIVPLYVVDLSFLSATIVKIPEGGWVPLVIASVACLGMNTYKWDREQEERSLALATMTSLFKPPAVNAGTEGDEGFEAEIPHAPKELANAVTVTELISALCLTSALAVGVSRESSQKSQKSALLGIRSLIAYSSGSQLLAEPTLPLVRTRALVIFLTPFEWAVPQALGVLARTLGCLPSTIVLLTVKFEGSVPFVCASERVSFSLLSEQAGLFQIIVHLGYAETLNAARLLDAPYDTGKACAADDLEAAGVRAHPHDVLPVPLRRSLSHVGQVTFVLTRSEYVSRKGSWPLARARLHLYRLLVQNARSPRGMFGLPPENTIEVTSVCFI